MSHPDAILELDNSDSAKKIIYTDCVVGKITEIEKYYKTKVLTQKEINYITKLILQYNTPQKIDVLKLYGISPDEIIPGVQCPNCESLPMIRKLRYWLCSTCNTKSADAHKKAIIDCLLIHSFVTSEQFRHFLQIPKGSKNLLANFLNQMKIPYTGTTNNRVYYLPDNYF
jgi:hypothetical protein